MSNHTQSFGSPYFPALYCAYTFLFNEKDHRKDNNAGIKLKNREKDNLTLEQIDEIIRESFGLSFEDTRNLRKFFFENNHMRHLALRGFTSEEVAMLLKLQKDPNLANLVMDTILLSNFDEPVSLLQEKDIKPIKISGFYRDIFKYECESYHINLPDNILDGITLLSHFPETASTFFKQSACKVPDENTPDIKSMLNDIHADFFNIINSLSANLSFWIVFLKYLPHFRTQLQIWELIVFITHLSTQVKNETIDSISHISSSLPVNEIKSRKRSLTYLLQWSKDLSKVDSSSNTSKNDLKEAFFNSSVLDLVMLQRHFSVVEPLCRTPLTPEDIHLIYLMESYLTRDEKELLFDSLTPELFPSYIL